MTSYLSATELTDALNLRDLSNPDQGHLAMRTLLGGVASSLAGHWGIAAETIRHSPLVAVADNYDKLGFDSHPAARIAAAGRLRPTAGAARPRLSPRRHRPHPRGCPAPG